MGFFKRNIGSIENKSYREFISIWKTDNAGESASNQIQLPITNSNNKLKVDWGDGNVTSVTNESDALHTYSSAGTYTIKIEGLFGSFSFYDGYL